ncbi:DedA family protein [Calditerrivibrio nitroreducens]|uniref:SNARE associated Golgi protein-related protein n=1 Tax=Calditerrivibrio nitroreducens (strain DSM 19672 / NBRC 101217 / Yu37-1) TaxID=768670 RepID=E4TJN0_CALNY|nr:DedA family protein [Calditerrivibrio nitroreducens]ADR18192.1 SNARE associated Golgi protein-related protein [Calditerrivibrio nitroreducens DSM 19672]
MIQQIASFVVNMIDKTGYFGIAFFMLIESSFIPFPSEVVVPPAGYLVSQGKMNMYLVVLSSLIGSVVGGLVNYYLAVRFGRPFILRYGKYFFLGESKFQKVEKFFKNHGEITTFVGRLLPGIRQYISFPAGLARMNLFRFCLFTALGAGIWSIVLAYTGYFVGTNLDMIKEHINKITIVILPTLVVLVIVYIFTYKKYLRWRNYDKKD